MAQKIDAIADLITPGLFRVETWDRDAPGDRETYEISAPDERRAAFMGIQRFSERKANVEEK